MHCWGCGPRGLRSTPGNSPCEPTAAKKPHLAAELQWVYGKALAVIMVTYGLSELIGNAVVSAVVNIEQAMSGFICLMVL